GFELACGSVELCGERALGLTLVHGGCGERQGRERNQRDAENDRLSFPPMPPHSLATPGVIVGLCLIHWAPITAIGQGQLAEDRGFEPLRAFTQHAFQACALGHYANPPPQMLPEQSGW